MRAPAAAHFRIAVHEAAVAAAAGDRVTTGAQDPIARSERAGGTQAAGFRLSFDSS